MPSLSPRHHEIVRAVDECCVRVNKQIEEIKQSPVTNKPKSPAEWRERLARIERVNALLDCICPLIIGRTQQRLLKRRSRRCDVDRISKKIAEKTGADEFEVREFLLECLTPFINRSI